MYGCEVNGEISIVQSNLQQRWFFFNGLDIEFLRWKPLNLLIMPLCFWNISSANVTWSSVLVTSIQAHSCHLFFFCFSWSHKLLYPVCKRNLECSFRSFSGWNVMWLNLQSVIIQRRIFLHQINPFYYCWGACFLWILAYSITCRGATILVTNPSPDTQAFLLREEMVGCLKVSWEWSAEVVHLVYLSANCFIIRLLWLVHCL